MHTLEPFYNWQHIYSSQADRKSPFFGREYSEFLFSQTIYNYYIHPQWDDFGSRTLYLKVLMADYEEGYLILELIGEWNDAVENDSMTLKRDVLEIFMGLGISKFLIIAENVLNFHSDTTDYYEELAEELNESAGWAVCLNLPDQSRREFERAHIDRYLELYEIPDWRTYRPSDLVAKAVSLRTARLSRT